MLYYITYKHQTLVGNIKYAIDLVNILMWNKNVIQCRYHNNLGQLVTDKIMSNEHNMALIVQ